MGNSRLALTFFSIWAAVQTTELSAQTLPEQAIIVIARNGGIYQSVKEASVRCSGFRVGRSGLEGLRSVYDPGPEIELFDAATRLIAFEWRKAMGVDLQRRCEDAWAQYGAHAPQVAKWLTR